MYLVTVKLDARGSAVQAKKEFRFGTWMEIAYWLDENSFIAEGYKVEIRFAEDSD